ncbi:hypothetical protein M0R45_015053 [Rubus argutus]|uniref:Uncharacterized protein n=1 Tax=Rubus argutus TaxID=59490 RepID=A0AAW1XPN4_RUBAR
MAPSSQHQPWQSKSPILTFLLDWECPWYHGSSSQFKTTTSSPIEAADAIDHHLKHRRAPPLEFAEPMLMKTSPTSSHTEHHHRLSHDLHLSVAPHMSPLTAVVAALTPRSEIFSSTADGSSRREKEEMKER